MDCAKEKHALPNLCYIHTLKRLSQRMFFSQRSLKGHCYSSELMDIGLGKKGIVVLIVTPTSASSIYI